MPRRCPTGGVGNSHRSVENADKPCAQPVDEGVDKCADRDATRAVTCADGIWCVWRQNTSAPFVVHGCLFIDLSTNLVTSSPRHHLVTCRKGPMSSSRAVDRQIVR